ncbi:MAG: hypothetical protein VX694_11225, partial [Planctomycetota bacterium]|nr:hypothetical protein [Planctomycetota bacterium]
TGRTVTLEGLPRFLNPLWFASRSANFFVPLAYFSEKAAGFGWLSTDQNELGSLRPHIGE